ncbi:hypothetical protein TELCIR_11932 [Teladorsagia circumcincta]|uniref:Uncharacterized protein n=1 Tax=Teladorsagia circumcincta TaxID=45464 RepID=A0A2G9U7V5_TELCI|nr:hypothetical protein TELCIR_11932 [Teladorsagia circumcincta]
MSIVEEDSMVVLSCGYISSIIVFISRSSASKSKPSPKAVPLKPSDENCEENLLKRSVFSIYFALSSSESSSKPPKPTKNVRSQEQNSPDDWTKIEVDNCPTISSATQLLGEALRTSPAEVRCTICKAMTPSEYVIRKQHVSSNHMPKDHTESDYIEILSDMMKKAYPTLTYNDLQCQIGGCRKEYKCMSSR